MPVVLAPARPMVPALLKISIPFARLIDQPKAFNSLRRYSATIRWRVVVGGYFTLVSNTSANSLLRFKFTTGVATVTVELGTGTKPHWVNYDTRLLATWSSGTTLLGQLLDANTGATIGTTFSISVTNNQFQAFRSYADGSVAYPAAGSSGTKLKIARVLPCTGIGIGPRLLSRGT
jgi:hypothetical protein